METRRPQPTGSAVPHRLLRVLRFLDTVVNSSLSTLVRGVFPFGGSRNSGAFEGAAFRRAGIDSPAETTSAKRRRGFDEALTGGPARRGQGGRGSACTVTSLCAVSATRELTKMAFDADDDYVCVSLFLYMEDARRA